VLAGRQRAAEGKTKESILGARIHQLESKEKSLSEGGHCIDVQKIRGTSLEKLRKLQLEMVEKQQN